MRKGFQFIPYEDVVTPIFDPISATIPDQTLSLRQMMMQFAYIGKDRLEDIVNRGFFGDEDDEDILGVDVGALDYAEVHDRVLFLQESKVFSRNLHQPTDEPEPAPTPEPVPLEDADA